MAPPKQILIALGVITLATLLQVIGISTYSVRVQTAQDSGGARGLASSGAFGKCLKLLSGATETCCPNNKKIDTDSNACVQFPDCQLKEKRGSFYDLIQQ